MLLALDISSKSTGAALFDGETLVDYKCFTASSEDVFKRKDKIVADLREWVRGRNITEFVAEDPLPANGTKEWTHRVLMWMQDSIVSMLRAEFGLKVSDDNFLYPGEWRKVCGIKQGRGVVRDSLKKADIEWANRVFFKEKPITNDDIADAVGIGYSRVHRVSDFPCV